MELQELFENSAKKPAEKELVIIGINPLANKLFDNSQLIADMLKVNKDLRITIIYEDPTADFIQSLHYDEKYGKTNTLDFDMLQGLKDRLIGNENRSGGFIDSILDCFDKTKRDSIKKRIKIFQNNLNSFINLILADDVISICDTAMELPKLEDYERINESTNPNKFGKYIRYVRFMLNEKSGGLFISEPGEELIQLYDNASIPRIISPRKAFYSTRYQRYSVWIFIFNRKGKLLLHKRSNYTADNRSLWDKSAGGHVDLKDRSTIMTAKREVVEELFMPEAEFTKYVTEKVRDFIDFGEWDTRKRPENYFKSDFEGLAPHDWVVFRPKDRETGYPMTIRRKSPRLMHVADLDDYGQKIPELDSEGKQIYNAKGKKVFKEHKEVWHTRFISDVYLMIAPENYIDTDEQMHKLMSTVELKGAGAEHKLVSIDDLYDDILTHAEKYTDDMVYMLEEQKWLLTQFSEFIKYIFKEKNR